MGNSDPCENGPNCWFLWNSDCWYKHPYEEKKKVLEMKREARRAFEEKKRAEENEIAEEAFTRIPALPEELKMHILHHLTATLIEKLELPISTLRAVLQVHISYFFQGWTILQPTDCKMLEYSSNRLQLLLQAREPTGSQELVKWTWMHRVVFSAEWLALIRLAKKADLVPVCPVVKPSIFNHSCSNFCKWFAPQGGWEAFYAKNHARYVGRNAIELEEEEEEGSDVEDYESDDSFEYDHEDFENDFGFGDGLDFLLDELEYAFLFL